MDGDDTSARHEVILDVTLRWHVLTSVETTARLKWRIRGKRGRPRGSGTFESAAECHAAIVDAIALLLGAGIARPTAEMVGRIFSQHPRPRSLGSAESEGAGAKRILRWREGYGLPPWPELVAEARARRELKQPN